MNTFINCDICERKIRLTANSKYLLEKDGWSIYCSDCAAKTKKTNGELHYQKIKVYKI